MARITLHPLLLLFSLYTSAQVLESHRITDWSKAGITQEIAEPTQVINILDHGADNTGVYSSNTAFSYAVQSLNGGAGLIYFPEGEYYFNAAISVPDSVVLKGESSATTLRFDLGGSGNLIVMNGSVINVEHPLASGAEKGMFELQLTDASEFEIGDVIRIGGYDEDLMYSPWAYGSLGQVLTIVEKDGNQIRFEDPLNHHYPLSRNPYIKKIIPRTAAGISCLTIEREDITVDQTSNIYIGNAINCFVRNIESINCNFSHIEVNSSAHTTVDGCYIHHAFAYGGGGQGYGVVFQATSSFNLAQNNVFNHLRHSMLMQSGANGNVYAYNYSYDPFWQEGFLPSNAAGDAVLHGNYVYLNLFEGNTVQNIVVDASHGSNGPYNTFFRNRAELYGFFSDSNTHTDSMNVVGNEITISGFPYGLFQLNGAGHYSYGNNVSGSADPANTTFVELKTLYLNPLQLPEFLNDNVLPMIGYPLAMNDKLVPAEERFDNQTYVSCNAELVTNTSNESENERIIFLQGHQLVANQSILPVNVNIYGINGQMLETFKMNTTHRNIPQMTNGIYLIQAVGRKDINSIKVLITR